MKMIDKYVYAVTKYLPADSREDVGKELRANIEDMLPENPTDEDVYKVLEKLGSPMKLAEEYNHNKRYLIGPAYYDRYIETLKIVIGIFITVFVGLAILSGVSDADSANSVNGYLIPIIEDLGSSIVEGALQGAFWVTLVFFIMEKTGFDSGDIPLFRKKWSPDELADIPTSNNEISRTDAIVSVFFTILFTAIVYFQPQSIAIYISKGIGSKTEVTPLFDTDRLKVYIPVILILAVIQIGLFVGKMIKGHWNKALAVSQVIYNVLGCILVIVMLKDSLLFNTAFFTKVFNIFKPFSDQTVLMWSNKIIYGIIAINIILVVMESVKVLSKGLGRRNFV